MLMMNGHASVLEYEFDFFNDMVTSCFKMVNFNMIKVATAIKVSQVDGKEYSKAVKDVFPLSDSKDIKVDEQSMSELMSLSKVKG